MATAIRGVGPEDRLTVVEHLDELRTRIIICLAVLGVSFSVCLWQNGAILGALNRPLTRVSEQQAKSAKGPLQATARFQTRVREFAGASGAFAEQAARSAGSDSALAAQADRLGRASRALAASVPADNVKLPVTLGVGEPFTQTIKVAAWGALLLSLPILLLQLYGFIIPAFSKRERQIAVPLMFAVPVLFYGGVVFAYFAVLPNAIAFLQNFNSDNFDIQLQAKDFYSFSVMVVLSVGALFQIPVALIALTSTGIVSVAQLRGNRRIAVVACAFVAMILPGNDPVTMSLIAGPLYLLFEGSIVLAALIARRAAKYVDLPATEDDESETTTFRDGD